MILAFRWLMDTNRILEKLDIYFSKNDYVGAEKHLKYWLDEAVTTNDDRSSLLLCNELIGLSRKTNQKEQTFRYANTALELIKKLDMQQSVTAATTYINVATAYKAFGNPVESLPFFEQACSIYEKYLSPNDSRLGGLYNNMALTFSDLKHFKDAYDSYQKALTVMAKADKGELEMAITHLNIASTLEAELGLLDADELISEHLDKATVLLDTHKDLKDGYYAFVCEKCASCFGYYGRFLYEKELKERALMIYERN